MFQAVLLKKNSYHLNFSFGIENCKQSLLGDTVTFPRNHMEKFFYMVSVES